MKRQSQIVGVVVLADSPCSCFRQGPYAAKIRKILATHFLSRSFSLSLTHTHARYILKAVTFWHQPLVFVFCALEVVFEHRFKSNLRNQKLLLSPFDDVIKRMLLSY